MTSQRGFELLESSLANAALPTFTSLPIPPLRTTSAESIPNGLNVGQEKPQRGSGPWSQEGLSKPTMKELNTGREGWM